MLRTRGIQVCRQQLAQIDETFHKCKLEWRRPPTELAKSPETSSSVHNSRLTGRLVQMVLPYTTHGRESSRIAVTQLDRLDSGAVTIFKVGSKWA